MIGNAVREAIVDDALRRVAVVHQQHSIKGALAILRLVERFPQWGPDAPGALAEILREEPRAPDLGSQLPASIDLGIVGGGRRLVEKAVFPAAYAAMRQWVGEESLDAVMELYRERACAEPDYLGHNVSIYCSLLAVRPLVHGDDVRERLFLDRLTEFVTATFHCAQNRIVFESRPRGPEPATRSAVLEAAFRQPGFFGHQILAFVWARRHAGDLGVEGCRRVLGHLLEMSHWRIPEKNLFSIEPAEDLPRWEPFAEAVRQLAFHGPESIHRVTLADALVDVWDQAEDDRTRALALAAARHFACTPRAR